MTSQLILDLVDVDEQALTIFCYMEFSLMKKQMKNAQRRRQKVMFQSEMIIAKYGPIEWHHSTFENNVVLDRVKSSW